MPRGFLLLKKRCPTQGRGAEPLPNLVGYPIQTSVLLPLILIEQEPLPQLGFIEAADAHPDEPHGKMAGGKSLAEHFVGHLPKFMRDVRGFGQCL